MDTIRIRELLDKRDEIDAEIREAVAGTSIPKDRKPQTCGTCGEAGHSSRTCPKKTLSP